MVVDLDLHYLYKASVLTSALASISTSASEVNISNSHNSLIFQARRLKFGMVVDIDLLFLYLASGLTSASASTSASEVNISNSLGTHSSFKLKGQISYICLNSHNSLDLYPGLGGQYSNYPKFCKVVDLNNFHRLFYYTKYHEI